MENLSRDTWRIIDANLNRISEGLRVLEEIARLRLNDSAITQQLKTLRHQAGRLPGDEPRLSLLIARDAAADVGKAMNAGDGKNAGNIIDLITANARRVEEALRVMEELAKINNSVLDSESYRAARFSLYTLEKELAIKASLNDKLERLRGLYVIIDAEYLRGRNPAEICRAAIKGGARIIQYRNKVNGIRRRLADAEVIFEVCQKYDVLFIVNDSLEVALATGADGLHIGQDDLPVDIARRLLPPDKILGCSARTVAEAKQACKLGADHLGVGAMFKTVSKEAEVVGVARLKEIKQAVAVPLVAIGGINRGNIAEVMRAGATAACVISAVMAEEDIEAAVRQLVSAMEEGSNGQS